MPSVHIPVPTSPVKFFRRVRSKLKSQSPQAPLQRKESKGRSNTTTSVTTSKTPRRIHIDNGLFAFCSHNCTVPRIHPMRKRLYHVTNLTS